MNRLQFLEPGTRVDRYVVLDILGQGGMAVVYRVRHEQLGSLHALKVVVVPNRNIMNRLVVEGQAQARLRHRNVVQVTNVIEVEGSPGLIMEYVPGPSLEKLSQNVQLDLTSIDRLGRQILRGIGAAHDLELVHRDLKPANILCSFEEDGLVPKIADFGLVKDLGREAGNTRTGSVMGTPNYMSPEQIRDTKGVDARTDLFAVGAILYELLARRLAFPGEDLLEVFNAVVEGRFVPIRELRPDAPDRMVDAIEWAMRTRREDRPPSAAALLEKWCGGVADQSLPPIELPQSTVDWIKSVTLAPPETLPPARPQSQGGTISVEELPEGPEPSPAQPAVRPPTTRLVGGGLALAVVLAVLCTGGSTLALVTAGGTWWSVSGGQADAPRDPEPPNPTEPEVPEAPQPQVPGPELPAPDLVAPVPPGPVVPGPVVPVPPTPRDVTPPLPVPDPAVPTPDPTNDFAPPSMGAVTASGARKVMLEGRSGGMINPGSAVPPGPYTVYALFEGSEEVRKVLDITVVAGKTVRISCADGMKKCRVTP